MKYILLSLILIAVMYIGSKIVNKLIDLWKGENDVKDKR